MTTTIILIVIICCVLGMVWPQTPKKPPPLSKEDPAPSEPAHPWASGVPNDFDDFAGPLNIYGPGTSEEDDSKG